IEIKGRARIHRTIAQELISGAVQPIGPALRYGAHLCAARSTAFGGVHGRIHTKLGDRFQRNIQPCVPLLALLLDAGSVYSIKGEIVVVAAPPHEADALLPAIT